MKKRGLLLLILSLVIISTLSYNVFASEDVLCPEGTPHVEVAHEAKAPTCTEVGHEAYVTCEVCDYTTYVEIPATGHQYSEVVTPNTCTEQGYTTYTCACGDTYVGDYVEPTHMTMVGGPTWVESIEIGNTSESPFTLVDGVYHSTNKESLSISKLSITAIYDCVLTLNYWVSSDTNDNLVITHKDEKLVEIYGKHDWTELIITLEAGEVANVFYQKNWYASAGSDKIKVTVEATKTLIDTSHLVPSEEVEPTCTGAVICYYCQTEIKAALGHDEVHHEGEAATCTKEGYADYITCNRCDYSTYATLPMLPHEYEAVVTPPTCTDGGYTTHTCVCGDSYIADEVSPLGHDEVFNEGKAATCTEVGYYDYYTCSRCEYTTYEEIPMCEHTVLVGNNGLVDPIKVLQDHTYPFVLHEGVYHSTNKVDNRISWITFVALYDCRVTVRYAVSSESGDYLNFFVNSETRDYISGEVDYKEVVLELSAGDEFSFAYEKDIMFRGGQDEARIELIYDMVEVNDECLVPYSEAPASCTHDYYCAVCEALLHKAEGHKMVEVTDLAPTCVDYGFTGYKHCEVCYATEMNAAPPTGHSYQAVVTPPTCTEAGYTTHTCHCGDTYEDGEVSALGHDEISHEAKAPTCTEGGHEAHVDCSRCDYSTIVVIPATGHSHESEVTPPTCTEAGYTTHTCHCGDTYTDSEVDALGHDEISHEAKAPTCTEGGHEAYLTCSRCDYTTYSVIPPSGHSHDGTITPPTCTEGGYTTYTCHCGDTYIADEVSANGHIGGSADCTESAVCEICGVKYGEPLGHIDADKNLKCERCGEKIGEISVGDGAIASITLAGGVGLVALAVVLYIIRRKRF